jgi:hypothetical protein
VYIKFKKLEVIMKNILYSILSATTIIISSTMTYAMHSDETDLQGRIAGQKNHGNMLTDKAIEAEEQKPDVLGRMPGQDNYGSIATDEFHEAEKKKLDIHGRSWGDKNYGSILTNEEEAQEKKRADEQATLKELMRGNYNN